MHLKCIYEGNQNLKIELNSDIQERLLKAFLDLIILQTLKHHPMTAYEINNCIFKKHKSKINPNVIYTKLATMQIKN